MSRIVFVTSLTKDYLPTASRLLGSLKLLKAADAYVVTNGFDMPNGDGYKTIRMPSMNLPLRFCPQQGQLVDLIPDLNDDDIVIMADADACIQRDLSPDEVFWINQIVSMAAMGDNVYQGQDAVLEVELCKPRVSNEKVEELLGIELSRLMVYNCGFTVAKPPTWRKIRKKFEELWPINSAFDEWRCCQLIICAAMRLSEISVVNVGRTLHTHGHFPLHRIHVVKDGVLYYGNRPVFYVHHVAGFFGEKLPILDKEINESR